MTTTTQLEAWDAIQPHLGPLQSRMLEYLKNSDGATDEQIRTDLSMRYGSACARRKELQVLGLVRDSGRTGVSSVGRKVIIWEAV